jgi:hypothetical protein
MTLAHTAVRRTAAFAAAAALTGGALVAGAGAASADTVVDITGVVTNAAGAPLVDAQVTAYVQSGGKIYGVDFAETDATGRYSFTDLDAATLAQFYPGADARSVAIRTATSFKLQFSKSVPVAETRSNPGYLTRSFGGTQSINFGTPVAVNGTTAATANQSLPSAAGMVVRVTGATGAPVTDYGFASVYAADALDPLDASVDGADTQTDDSSYDNPATPAVEPAPVDGLVYVGGLEPGAYNVLIGGSDEDATTGVFRNYLSRFIGGDGTYAKAAEVTATAGAFVSTGGQLTDTLTTIQSPRIIGNSSVGSTLKADPGVWLRQQGTEFAYTWTRKGTPVATGATYKLGKADRKKKIGLIVTAVTQGDGFFGSAAAKPTSKVGEKSKVKAKRDGYGFDVTVTVAKKAKAKKVGKIKGKVVLLTEDGEVASKKAKLKGGKVNDLTPKRAFLSEKKLVVQYLGAGKLGSDTVNVKAGGGGKKKK